MGAHTGGREELTPSPARFFLASARKREIHLPCVVPGPGGQPALAVVAGAYYDVWGKEFAIPMEALSTTPDGEHLAAHLSKIQLSRAPKFKEGLNTADEAGMGEIYRFYGIQSSWGASLEQMNPGTVDGYRYDYYWLWQ
jgi:hypothetical protein